MDHLGTALRAVSGFSSIFSFFAIDNNNPKYDPLSSLVKLALLKEQPTGTRLSFKKYTFEFQEPCLSQSVQRRAYGEDHTDLAKLESPIKQAIQLYDPTKSQSIGVIFKRAIEGLNQLMQTYNPPQENGWLKGQKKIQSYQQTQSSIKTYIRYLEDSLNGIQVEKIKTDSNTANSPIAYEKLWESDEIDLVAQGLETMDKYFQKNDDRWKRAMNAVRIFAMSVDHSLQEQMEKQ